MYDVDCIAQDGKIKEFCIREREFQNRFIFSILLVINYQKFKYKEINQKIYIKIKVYWNL